MTENCSAKDGWYDTDQTAWISSGACVEKKQKKREYRDYSCAPANCTYSVTDYSFVDLNETRNKADNTSCSDGLFCTVNDKCNAGKCGGSAKDCSGNSYSEIAKCDNNPDSKSFTWDFSASFTSVCDEANDKCTTKTRSFTHACAKKCGAVCESNLDCDDRNATTIDKCDSETCGCTHLPIGECGNGRIDANEECEISGSFAGWGPRGYSQTCEDDNTWDKCNSSCRYEHINECKYYCSADFACEGARPNVILDSCTAFGYKYLRDSCDDNCHLKDNECEDDYSGCTGKTECDGFLPNTHGCNYMCEYKPLYPSCGNGMIDAGEECDSNTRSCTSDGHAGVQSCNSSCKWSNACSALPYCGDGTCTADETCSSCSGDCGACKKSGGGGGGGGRSSGGSSYSSNWVCGNWSNTCINGFEHRTCTLNGVNKDEKRNCTVKRESSNVGVVEFTIAQSTPVLAASTSSPVEEAYASKPKTSTETTPVVPDKSDLLRNTNLLTGYSVASNADVPVLSGFWIFVIIGLCIFGLGVLIFGMKRSKK
jgi:hypothetical protein